jgi:hypothetical protein
MFEQAFRNIDDALRKEAGCTTELDYTEQTSWRLFLKYLDGLEQDREIGETIYDGDVQRGDNLKYESSFPFTFEGHVSTDLEVIEVEPDPYGWTPVSSTNKLSSKHAPV